MQPGRKWRRTAVMRNGKLQPLSDNWSLIDEETGLAIAQIYKERNGMWSYIIRSLQDGKLIDNMMGGNATGPEAKEHCQAQTSGLLYLVERKRTKAEILAHAGVRPLPKKQWKSTKALFTAIA